MATATLDGVVHLESPAALRRLVDDVGRLLADYDRPGAEGALAVRALTVLLPAIEEDDR